MDVGVIGLGAMGSAMASKLVKDGHKVRVWNRSRDPVEKLAKEGAIGVEQPQEALQGEAALTMLADDAAIAAVLLDGGALEKARRGLAHVVTATISVDFAKRLEKIHTQLGLGYVAAPVLGRPDAAAAGGLNVLAAGDAALVRRIQPLLNAIGKQTWVVGAAPHQANLVKIAANFALARRHNVDPGKLIEVFTGTLFAAPAYKLYGPAILNGKFEPAGFKLALGLKDVRLALTASEKSGAPRRTGIETSFAHFVWRNS